MPTFGKPWAWHRTPVPASLKLPLVPLYGIAWCPVKVWWQAVPVPGRLVDEIRPKLYRRFLLNCTMRKRWCNWCTQWHNVIVWESLVIIHSQPQEKSQDNRSPVFSMATSTDKRWLPGCLWWTVFAMLRIQLCTNMRPMVQQQLRWLEMFDQAHKLCPHFPLL